MNVGNSGGKTILTAPLMLVAVWVCLLWCFGASSAVAKNPEDIRIAYSMPHLANPWFHGVVDGMQRACKELGIKCDVVDANNNKRKQSADIRKMITSHYDAILVTSIDSLNTGQLFALAKNLGIVTGSLAQTALNSNLVYGMDEFAYGEAIGKQAGEWAQKALKCRGKVLLLTQDKIITSQARGDGIVQALNSLCPELQVVARYHADDLFRSMMVTDIALGHHEDLNMVVATTDAAAIGGYIIMTANKRQGDQYAVFSGDSTPDALELMSLPRSIYRGTIDLDPNKSGYESTKILYDMVQNGVPSSPVTKQLPFVAVPQKEAHEKLVMLRKLQAMQQDQEAKETPKAQ